MKKMRTSTFATAAFMAVTSISLAQELVDLGGAAQPPAKQVAKPGQTTGPVLLRTERGETRIVSDETGPWSDLVEYDRKTNETKLTTPEGTVHRITGRITKVKLREERIVNNYDLRTGKPHTQRFAPGTEVWVDEKGVIIAKVSCRNPISTLIAPSLQTQLKETTVFKQRERTRTVRQETDVHHYYKEYVPVDRPVFYRQYQLVVLRGPGGPAPLTILGAPNVSYPGGGGIAYSAGTRFDVTQVGGGAVVKNENNNSNANSLNNTNGIVIGDGSAGSASGATATKSGAGNKTKTKGK
jgi:hypothetical protein